MNGFERSKAQLNVNGVPQSRVQDLGADLMGLFGSVEKGVNTYVKIGEQTASIDARDKINSATREITLLQEELIKYKEVNDTQGILNVKSGINSIVAGVKSYSEEYKDNIPAQNKFNSLVDEWGTGTLAKWSPTLDAKWMSAYKTTKLNEVNESARLKAVAGLSFGEKEITDRLDEIRAAGIGDETVNKVENSMFTLNLNNISGDIASSPENFLSLMKEPDGTISPKWKEKITSIFMPQMQITEEGTVISKLDSNGKSYSTQANVTLYEKTLGDIQKTFFKEGTQHSIQLDITNGNISTDTTAVLNGSVSKTKIQDISKIHSTNSDTWFKLGSTSQQRTNQKNLSEFDAAVSARNQLENVLTQTFNTNAKELGSLVANGYSIDVQQDGVMRKFDFNSDVVVKLINDNITNFESQAIGNDGTYDSSKLTTIVDIMNNSGINAKSALVSSILDSTLRLGVTSSKTHEGMLKDVQAARVVLSYMKQDVNMPNKERANSAYLNALEENLQNKNISIEDAKRNASKVTEGIQTSQKVVSDVLLPVKQALAQQDNWFSTIPDIESGFSFGEADSYTLSDENTNVMVNRMVIESNYQSEDLDTIKTNVGGYIQDNSYNFQSSLLPFAPFKLVPKVKYSDGTFVDQDRFVQAVGVAIMRDARAKNVVEHKTFTDKSGKIVPIVNLGNKNVDVQIIDTEEGSVAKVYLYPKDRKPSDKPINKEPIFILPSEYKKYDNKLPFTTGATEWFRTY